jgi:HAD superfamily hydrolase (TIGR01509 family)
MSPVDEDESKPEAKKPSNDLTWTDPSPALRVPSERHSTLPSYDDLVQENFVLKNRCAKSEADFERLLRDYNSVLGSYRRLKQKQLQWQVAEGQVDRLKDIIDRADKDKEALRNTLRDQEIALEASTRKITQLLGELSAYRVDKASTYISDASDRPQNHLLAQEYKGLKDQAVHSLALTIFRLRSSDDSQSDRKREIALIKSSLSELVFREGARGITAKASSAGWEDAARKATLAIESRFAGVSVDQIRSLVERSFSLLERISQANPPGQLWLPLEGEPFDPTQHEATLDCEGDGIIDLAVLPGYRVENRVFEKALVRTRPQEGLQQETQDVTLKGKRAFAAVLFDAEAIVDIQAANNARFVPGFVTFHEKIRERFKTAIVSSMSNELLTLIDRRLDLSRLFGGNIFSFVEDEQHPKLISDLLTYAARQLDSAPSTCLVIYDAPPGIEAARGAGMGCIALTNRYPAESFSDADQLVSSFEEIDIIFNPATSSPDRSPLPG